MKFCTGSSECTCFCQSGGLGEICYLRKGIQEVQRKDGGKKKRKHRKTERERWREKGVRLFFIGNVLKAGSGDQFDYVSAKYKGVENCVNGV